MEPHYNKSHSTLLDNYESTGVLQIVFRETHDLRTALPGLLSDALLYWRYLYRATFIYTVRNTSVLNSASGLPFTTCCRSLLWKLSCWTSLLLCQSLCWRLGFKYSVHLLLQFIVLLTLAVMYDLIVMIVCILGCVCEILCFSFKICTQVQIQIHCIMRWNWMLLALEQWVVLTASHVIETVL